MKRPVRGGMRRLAGVPDPYEDEVFGSWLARLAAAHHSSRDDFLRVLLREAKITSKQGDDFGATPSPAFSAELCRRTGWNRDRLECLIIPLERRVPAFKMRALESYCPACWDQDRETGTRRVRRLWRERWGVMCDIHCVPLRESNRPAEVLLCGRINEGPDWCEERPPGCFPKALSVEVARAQKQVRALEAKEALPPEILERATVLRDLALVAGTRFPGESLVEWSLTGPGVSRRKLHWRDGRDPMLTECACAEPCGPLEVRQHALRLATLFVLEMEGVRCMERQEDLIIAGMLTLIHVETNLAWAINAARRTWSAKYKEGWAVTCQWPDGRDPVIWAQNKMAARANPVLSIRLADDAPA